MERLSRYAIDFMLKNGVISERDEEVYLFGLTSMLRTLTSTLTIIGIGALFNMMEESIVFIIFSSLIRSYSGGFHSDIPIVCYLISVANTILMLLIIKLQLLNMSSSFTLVVASIVVILSYAPVEHKNKPLEVAEMKIYKQKLLIIVIALSVSMSSFMLLDYKNILYAGSLAFGISSFMVLYAKLQSQ